MPKKSSLTTKFAKSIGKLAKAFLWISKNFIYYCRYPYLSVPLIGFLSGVFLYHFHGTEIAAFFIVTIIAWLASDFLTPFIIAGGKGIFQFKINNTLTVAEGYGFLTFFGVILSLTLGINLLCDNTTNFLSNYLSDFWIALLIGFILSLLVFIDLYWKFYKHEKPK